MVPHNYKTLKARQESEHADYPQQASLRIHRVLSWLGRAEQSADNDARFIFLWIAFNASYAEKEGTDQTNEMNRIRNFIALLVGIDDDQLLLNVLSQAAEDIHQLMNNKYICKHFWRFQDGRISEQDWQERFAKERDTVQRALREYNTQTVLNHVFSPLYVLRNQIIHGSATWGGSVNREQVKHGSNLLGSIVPQVLHLLMDHPNSLWQECSYPVVG